MFTKETLDEHLYWYKVRVDFLYDGDSITALKLDFGFGFSRTVKRGDDGGIRFYGLDTPELNTPEGKDVRDLLKPLEGKYVYVRSHKDKSGKYGRYLFELFVPTDAFGFHGDVKYMNLNQYLLDKGYAKPM